jgi:uncharacterized cysteine cluster protein YcgN (CxxCxxCC family)
MNKPPPAFGGKSPCRARPRPVGSLCDGCGRCCLHKLEDEDTGELFPTNVACKLLDRRSGRCTDYKNRKKLVATACSCPDRLEELEWLPDTCAYKLRADGEPLPDWHYLRAEAARRVHEAGMSTRGWTVSEVDAGELEFTCGRP